MELRVVTEGNLAVLEYALEGNGHEQIHSRQIASDTKAGQCQCQVIDTGRCLLWMGRFNIYHPFSINVNAANEGLHLLANWPEEPGKNFASLFANPLLLYHIHCLAARGESSSLRCEAGSGQFLLLCYRKDFGIAGAGQLWAGNLPLHARDSLWRPDAQQASILQHILYYPVKTLFQQEYLRIKSEELFLLYCQELSNCRPETILPADIEKKMQEADHLIRSNPEKNYSIDELSKLLLLSNTRLQRYFKAYCGCSIHQYILAVKMKAASQLLGRSNLSSKEIAFELGYKSDANFSEAFKKYFGFPPGQLRKRK